MFLTRFGGGREKKKEEETGDVRNSGPLRWCMMAGGGVFSATATLALTFFKEAGVERSMKQSDGACNCTAAGVGMSILRSTCPLHRDRHARAAAIDMPAPPG